MEIFIPITVLIVFGSLLAGLGIICWMVVNLLRPRASRAQSDEEARIIQEVYQGLIRMEERVEALETLLQEPRQRSGR